jgi:shikimate dehydrogenase
LDEIDPLAERIGAVNTIVNRAGRLVGYNTDAPGFLRALREKVEPAFALPNLRKHGELTFSLRNTRVVLLGNGGAARAAAIALLDNQVGRLAILGRSEERLGVFLAHLRRHHARDLQGLIMGTPQAERYLSKADIVVNTTSVGLEPADPTILLNVQKLRSSALIMDMIFNPPLTPLLQAAQERDISILNGLSMLLYQGTLALELWTGLPAPEEAMRAALETNDTASNTQ